MTDEVKTQLAVLTQEVSAMRKSMERMASTVERNVIEMAELRGAREAQKEADAKVAKRGLAVFGGATAVGSAAGAALAVFAEKFGLGGGG